MRYKTRYFNPVTEIGSNYFSADIRMIIVILSKMLDHSSVDIRHYFKLYNIFFIIWL